MNSDELHIISRCLIDRKETVAVAESVTAGNLQSAFSLAENAMQIFQGGITTYNIGQKTRHLNVDPIHAMSCNCVSETVAKKMATRVIKLFSSDWGIAITGYASPDPAQGVQSLYAFYSLAYQKEIIQVKRIEAEHVGIKNVQNFYTEAVIKDFKEILLRYIKS